MRAFVRLVVSVVVAIAMFYFSYWLVFSLIIPLDDFGWIRNLGSLAPAIFVGMYTWFQTGSVSRGLAKCIVLGAVITGGLGFVAGFIGPIIFTPGANQGPLLGFFTGPLGFVVGAVGGAMYFFTSNRRNNNRAP